MGNNDNINENDRNIEISGVPDDIQFPLGFSNKEHDNTESSDSNDNFFEIDTTYRNIPSIEIIKYKTNSGILYVTDSKFSILSERHPVSERNIFIKIIKNLELNSFLKKMV